MQKKDNVNAVGKAKLQDKFLGVNPYRRLGTDTAVPKLWISINVDGKCTVMWDRQEKHVEVAEAGISKLKVGQAAKKPNTLA